MSKPILLKEFLQKNKKLKNPPQETPVGTTGLLLVYIYIYIYIYIYQRFEVKHRPFTKPSDTHY